MYVITGLGIYILFPFHLATSYWSSISLIYLLKTRIYLFVICQDEYVLYFNRKTYFIHIDLFFTKQDSFIFINFYSSTYDFSSVFSLTPKALFNKRIKLQSSLFL